MIDKFPWLGLYHKSLKELPASSNQPVSAYTSRVSQIDAELLDNEIENHLLTVVWEAFVPFKYPFRRKWELEIIALIRLIISLLAIKQVELKGKPSVIASSYGSKLQNLNLLVPDQPPTISKHRLICLVVAEVFGKYGSDKLQQYMIDHEWSRSSNNWRYYAWKVYGMIEKIWYAFSLLHFLTFLYNGRYRSPLHRLFAASFTYATPQRMRMLDYEFMNRQLLWQVFTELLLFVLPFVRLDELRTRFLKLKKGVKENAKSECPICILEEDNGGQAIIIPVLASCGCRYCYFCLATRQRQNKWTCIQCGKEINDFKRCGRS